LGANLFAKFQMLTILDPSAHISTLVMVKVGT